MGFYGGETGEEVEKDWDNLRDYYGTSVKYLKKLLRANRLPLGVGVSCVTGTRLFFSNFGVTETADGDAARSSPSIFLVFHCHD